MVRMAHISSSTRNILPCISLDDRSYTPCTHQLKPSRGSKGSATIDPAMAAGRCVEVPVVVHHGTTGNARMADVLARERALGLLGSVCLAAFTTRSQRRWQAPRYLADGQMRDGSLPRSPRVRRDLREARHGAGESLGLLLRRASRLRRPNEHKTPTPGACDKDHHGCFLSLTSSSS